MFEQHFSHDQVKNLSLLVIGAGEIAEDVLKYLPKFQFQKVAISNRTEKRAGKLAAKYGIQTYEWDRIEKGNFDSFDVIITAVSNRKNLIKEIKNNWPIVIQKKQPMILLTLLILNYNH